MILLALALLATSDIVVEAPRKVVKVHRLDSAVDYLRPAETPRLLDFERVNNSRPVPIGRWRGRLRGVGE